MTAVFPITPSYTLTHEIRYTNFIGIMGDGHEQRVNKNLNWGTRGDGLGGSGSSYKGQNVFKLTFKMLPYGSGKLANDLWSFYIARLGSIEAFYFYNPVENDIDPQGQETTGRYLVRFSENNLSRELFAYCLFSASLELIEVRS